RVGMVLGTSTKLDYAAESWRKAVKLAKKAPLLRDEIPKVGGVRKAKSVGSPRQIEDGGFSLSALHFRGRLGSFR
ncbi:MAG: hypothetical protein VW226_13720, partial [Rhodospirillaceae bacterium]